MRLDNFIQKRESTNEGPPGLVVPPTVKDIETWAKEVREYNKRMKSFEAECRRKYFNGEI